jgi:hypothetical protein
VSAGVWFWILFVLCVVLGGFFWWPRPSTNQGPVAYYPLGGWLVIAILLALLGWGVFGPPIR